MLPSSTQKYQVVSQHHHKFTPSHAVGQHCTSPCSLRMRELLGSCWIAVRIRKEDRVTSRTRLLPSLRYSWRALRVSHKRQLCFFISILQSSSPHCCRVCFRTSRPHSASGRTRSRSLPLHHTQEQLLNDLQSQWSQRIQHGRHAWQA